MAHWDAWEHECDVTTPAHWDTWDDECRTAPPAPVAAGLQAVGTGDGKAVAALIRFVVWMGTLPKDVILEHGEPLLGRANSIPEPLPALDPKRKRPPPAYPGTTSKAKPTAPSCKRQRQ